MIVSTKKTEGHMRPLAMSIILSVISSLSSQPCTGHQVTDYGTFTPNASDSAAIARNNATINSAIAAVGQSGGGVVCLPEGTFYIGPDPRKSDVAITINYNGITLCGAGVDKTILRTNGTYALVNGAVRRGHGILIKGTADCKTPRKNITLKNFELDGQAGWTGKSGWPADTATGDGWDISHKGIIPSWDACVDSVRLENLYVHHFRGEIMYVGGMGMGSLTVRNVKMGNTNGSDFNLYGADLLVEHCEFAGPSRFWCELSARTNQGGYPYNRAVFRNNVFRDAVGATAIVMCQGDFQPYAFVFDSNQISNSAYGAFAFYGGVAGPVTITSNTITDIGGGALEFGYAPGSINSSKNANVSFTNNTVTRGGCLANFYASAESVVVRDNKFSGKTPGSSNGATAVFYGAITCHQTTIENNTFTDCRTPEQTAPVTGERPLFGGNTYVNNERRDQQASFWISAGSPKVTPHFEQVQVFTNTNNTVAQLETANYPDGQIIEVTGGSANSPVKFAAGQGSYTVSKDTSLNGSNRLYFKYVLASSKWIETFAPVVRVLRPVRQLSIAAVSNQMHNSFIAFNYSVAQDSRTKIAVFDMNGRCVRILYDGTQKSGIHFACWDSRLTGGQPANAGLYLVKLESGGSSVTGKILFIK
jgi:hypothetical protein